ncbi:MAG: hypothetical protein GF408_08450 [Candidatus Omnitrophica bacterium]|nr:hypothetical protein [Candidatus Omnitrophota bacterium]
MPISRTLRTAILISVGVHLAGMSAVEIITPEGLERIKPFTQVDFLGPILKKTAFEIMIEHSEPGFSTAYGEFSAAPAGGYLKVATPRRKFSVERYPGYFGISPAAGVFDFLSGSKSLPDMMLSRPMLGEPAVPRTGPLSGGSSAERQVVHRPEQPNLLRGLYGNEAGFAVRFRVLVDRAGNVKMAEPLTTTGFPQLDLKAAEYVKSWIFAPANTTEPGEEWVEVEVLLETGGR